MGLAKPNRKSNDQSFTWPFGLRHQLALADHLFFSFAYIRVIMRPYPAGIAVKSSAIMASRI